MLLWCSSNCGYAFLPKSYFVHFSLKLATSTCTFSDPVLYDTTVYRLWLLQHTPACHTLVVGAARPTDFDLAVRAASLLNTPDAQAKVMEGSVGDTRWPCLIS